ncbi:MAG: NAD(P)H-dependent glycerol-3-phosphate dehydrogenase [Clostridia bacterium]|nr:NAD(P)H-dependent glycerol-3-phosphate dehydrogenase [Clostridia bacterium]
MKISVLGCGRWGAFIAWYLDSIGHNVMTWGLPTSPHLIELKETRKNGMLEYPDSIELSDNLELAVSRAEVIVISISCQSLRAFLADVKKYNLTDKAFVLCMKGIEETTGCRLTQVVSDVLGDVPTAVWVGPGHPQNFVNGVPNCMVIDSDNDDLKRRLVEEFSGRLIRFYYGEDLIGSEVGAAAKNVIGIAAGMLDGLGYSCLKGALMSRGTYEVGKLIKAMGGSEYSAYGLCHLGDYEATLFSRYSQNRMFGETFVKGEKYTKLAEGVATSRAISKLSKKYGVEMPIVDSVERILSGSLDISSALDVLFSRSIKNEFAYFLTEKI